MQVLDEKNCSASGKEHIPDSLHRLDTQKSRKNKDLVYTVYHCILYRRFITKLYFRGK